LAPGLTN
jgi:hypothetical protein